jgi:hypothetical protein
MELGDGRRNAAWRPFKLTASPLDVVEMNDGKKVARYTADSWHKCPPKSVDRRRVPDKNRQDPRAR